MHQQSKITICLVQEYDITVSIPVSCCAVAWYWNSVSKCKTSISPISSFLYHKTTGNRCKNALQMAPLSLYNRATCFELCVCVLRPMVYLLVQQVEGQFQTEGSLIRSHCSKTAVISSYRDFPFEERRGEERVEVKKRTGGGKVWRWYRGGEKGKTREESNCCYKSHKTKLFTHKELNKAKKDQSL